MMNESYGARTGQMNSLADAEGHAGAALGKISNKREPQVLIALSRMDRQIESLQARAGELENRLGAVIHASQPTPETIETAKGDQEHKVPCAASIDELTQRIRTVVRKLESITERLEV